jgi:hypothetical protein
MTTRTFAAVFIGFGDRIAGALFAEPSVPVFDLSAGVLLMVFARPLTALLSPKSAASVGE